MNNDTWTRVAWRVGVVAVLLALLAAGGYLLWDASSGALPDWQVICDEGGSIEHVACVVSSARRAILRNADLVSTVVNALPGRARVTILTNDRVAFAVAHDPHPGRVELLDLPAESAFTIWPQDPFLVLMHRDGRAVLLQSADFPRADDRLIAQHLAQKLNWECRASKFSFEGGNMVVGGSHVFVGANTIRHNSLRLKMADHEVAREMQQELGRSVLVLGPVPQPVGHIDMIVTPLVGRRLLVADAAWGARLARDELKSNPQAVADFERACEEHYFGDPRIRELRDRSGQSIRSPSVLGQTAAAADDTQQIAAHLDRLSSEVARHDYQVLRVPFLFRRERQGADEESSAQEASPATAAAADSHVPTPTYPCLTYNNVLMETDGHRSTVYLPQYGWEAFDEAAAHAWQEAGYHVVLVQGLTISAMYGGSLRCCVKVLKRAGPRA